MLDYELRRLVKAATELIEKLIRLVDKKLAE